MAIENGPSLGRYRLRRRPELSPHWYIVWPDPSRPGRTKGVSTGTSDVRAAELALARHVVVASELRDAPPAAVPLAWVLVRYWERHASSLRSRGEAKRHLALWTTHFGAATVDQVTPGRMRVFVAELRGRGWGDSYIRRILGTGLAAMNFAYENGELASVPRIRPGKLGLGQGTPRQRILEVEELARFYDAIEEVELARYFVLLVATGCRPGAAVGLTKSRVDLVRNRIDFQDGDRAPTAKRQPILPLISSLLPWVTIDISTSTPIHDGKAIVSAASVPPVPPLSQAVGQSKSMKYKVYPTCPTCPNEKNDAGEKSRRVSRTVAGAGLGKKVAKKQDAAGYVVGRRDKALKLLWRAARTRAGLDDDVVPYAVRHTVATWLAEQDVPDPQVDAWLGHAKASTAGTWYIRRRVYHADYLSTAAAAIEALMARIAAQSERARPASLALSPEDFSGLRARGVQPPSHLRGGNPVNSFGAGEGIRTLDPNLGKVVLYP